MSGGGKEVCKLDKTIQAQGRQNLKSYWFSDGLDLMERTNNKVFFQGAPPLND